jgi:hypothetical protein
MDQMFEEYGRRNVVESSTGNFPVVEIAVFWYFAHIL